MPSVPVKPEFGPTLPALLRPWWRRASRGARAAAVAGVVLFVLLLAVAVASSRSGGSSGGTETTVVVERPVGFNLRHGETLTRVPPQDGRVLQLEAVREGLFLQSFAVSSLELPAYRGLPTAQLPVAAEAVRDRLEARFEEFALVEEGRARINEVPAYELVFTARTAEGRRLYGRWVMLVPLTEPVTPQRRGVVLELLGTPAAGIPNATSIGDEGQLKLPLRSFRFGTEPP